ncbi:MAG: tetratricopeptide repeat protein [Pseudohongiellaceae bacterium]
MMRYHRCFTGLITVATLLLGNPAAADVAADVKHLQERWAEINYQMEGNTQETAFDALMKEAEAIVAANPTSADALIWSGIIKSTYAGAKGGLGALALAKASKADLEKALEIDPNALQGSAYTSLGALYYSVPGWPVGFGDDERAEQLLRQALELNPEGIDPNYFYASFLVNQKRYAEAREYFAKAQAAAPRPGRALADSGRQQEISDALSDIANKN